MTTKKVKTEPVVSASVETIKKVKVKETFNAAVVKNGKYEVRRYTLVDHGEDFAKLANEFASKKGYQVELA